MWRFRCQRDAVTRDAQHIYSNSFCPKGICRQSRLAISCTYVRHLLGVLRIPLGDTRLPRFVSKVSNVSRPRDLLSLVATTIPSHQSSDGEFDLHYGRKHFKHPPLHHSLRHRQHIFLCPRRWPRLASVCYCFQYDGVKKAGTVAVR